MPVPQAQLVDVDTRATHALSQGDVARLLAAIHRLSTARDVAAVMEVVRTSARELTGADGVTFVLREGNLVHYAEENAVGPLWKGRRFPAEMCISGWAIAHRQTVVIEDIYADPRIPHDAYGPTFVRSLAMTPVRVADPLGAIGAYWASHHRATEREVWVLEALAATAGVALENAYLAARLHEAIGDRDDFLAMVSHELKAPLTPAFAAVQLVKTLVAGGEPSADVLAPYVDMAETALGRLSRLVSDLLEVAQLPRGGLTLQRAPVDLAELVDEVLAVQLATTPDCGVDVAVDVRHPVRGHWDRVRLRRVLSHLLGNALKFGAGSPVRVALEVVDDEAVLVVADQGPGIRAEDQERIFERFVRAASAATTSGFGLGLWLVREIVEAHGGRIGLTSVEGAGSTFRVTLPLGN
jgi:signal transduction histidine kinase